MKTINATQAKNQFGELLEMSGKEPVAIQKNGRDVAVIISAAEFQVLNKGVSIDDLVKKYHEESIERYGDLYAELAK